MNQNLTPAQLAQQSNRGPGGLYAQRRRGAVGGDLDLDGQSHAGGQSQSDFDDSTTELVERATGDVDGFVPLSTVTEFEFMMAEHPASPSVAAELRHAVVSCRAARFTSNTVERSDYASNLHQRRMRANVMVAEARVDAATSEYLVNCSRRTNPDPSDASRLVLGVAGRVFDEDAFYSGITRDEREVEASKMVAWLNQRSGDERANRRARDMVRATMLAAELRYAEIDDVDPEVFEYVDSAEVASELAECEDNRQRFDLLADKLDTDAFFTMQSWRTLNSRARKERPLD